MDRQSIASSRVHRQFAQPFVANPAPAAACSPTRAHAQGAINAQDGQPVPNVQEAQNGQPGNPDDALARAVVPSLPPLNLLATIQASPQGADDDNDDEHRPVSYTHLTLPTILRV